MLALIQKAGGQLNATNLQKLLFLFTRQQKEKSFDFVPFKYGCYSLQAKYDLSVMEKQELVEKLTSDNLSIWQTKTQTNYLKQLKPIDVSILNSTFNRFGSFSTAELIHYTYIKYPYYAINSTIKEGVLNSLELERVNMQVKKNNEVKLFSIGYEGISLETYLNKLIINGVNVLCDVRKNPLSKKFGFSKTQLLNACNNVGIEYIHIPELGIISDKRKSLNSPNDYKVLFDEYKSATLKDNKESLNQIIQLVKQHKRIALTCFERTPSMCHRSRITEELKNSPYWKIPIKHL